ncbi:MAG: hypothetical protein FWH37_09050 [Candidatus Bathyarchaeota archaeon]|nr:hypothetical protein [Candidatus Termiticorpusculum sp.]
MRKLYIYVLNLYINNVAYGVVKCTRLDYQVINRKIYGITGYIGSKLIFSLIQPENKPIKIEANKTRVKATSEFITNYDVYM